MKGRVYDPTFGRFISADPHIQSPLNSQSLNRYSYVMNNPLSFTDPSGYFLSGLKKAFKKFRKLIKKIIKKVIARIMKVINIVISMIPIKPIRDFVQKFWQPIALVVVAVYFPTMLTFVQNAFAIFNAAASYAGGGSLTKILANVAISMGIPNMQGLGASINGAINGINTAVSNVMGFLGDVGSAIGGAGLMGVAITSGLTSGVTSKLFGGSFSKGFKAGFKSAVVNAAFKRVENTIKFARDFRANPGKYLVLEDVAFGLNGSEDGQLLADNSGGPVNPFRDSEYTGNPDPGLEGVYPEAAIGAWGAVRAGFAGVGRILGFGPRIAWFRFGPSRSMSANLNTRLSARFGSNRHHRQKIPNQRLRELNESLHSKKLPGTGPRVADPGHFHIIF